LDLPHSGNVGRAARQAKPCGIQIPQFGMAGAAWPVQSHSGFVACDQMGQPVLRWRVRLVACAKHSRQGRCRRVGLGVVEGDTKTRTLEVNQNLTQAREVDCYERKVQQW
jgi:hypothetical protein